MLYSIKEDFASIRILKDISLTKGCDDSFHYIVELGLNLYGDQ